jgi:hypothetical protein
VEPRVSTNHQRQTLSNTLQQCPRDLRTGRQSVPTVPLDTTPVLQICQRGMCGALVEGAGGVVVTQGICVLCLFVSLVLSCVCSARWTEQGAGQKERRERRASNDWGSLSFRPVPVEEEEYCYNRDNHNHYDNVRQLEDPLLGPNEGGSQGGSGSSFVVPVKKTRFQSVQAFIGE